VNPTMFNELCLQQLTLCKVTEGESVAVLTRGEERHAYADSFMWAAQKLGASAFHVRLPEPMDVAGAWAVGDVGLGTNPLAVQALKSVDLVVDCAMMLFSKEQFEIQASGTRVLTAIEPVDVLGRLMPSVDMRRRVEFGQQLIQKASSLRITNEWGTDVTYQIGMYPTMTEYGYTDEPGRWDNWGCSFVFTGGADDGVDGTIVLGPGDIIHPFDTYVQNPVTFTIEKGFVQDIRGVDGHSSLDAELVKAYIDGFADPRGYGMSHVGWGLDERARWHSMRQDVIGVETRSYYGNVMFSTGPNNELGGPNDTSCHLDIPMRNCTLYLDDEVIVKDGDIVIPDMRPLDRR
jgi:2,5-dihydroxypyridine 5,6-dioxygenase